MIMSCLPALEQIRPVKKFLHRDAENAEKPAFDFEGIIGRAAQDTKMSVRAEKGLKAVIVVAAVLSLVIAVASGGPLETVQHEQTGLLCRPTADAFADALARLILDPAEAERMGQLGRQHVTAHFSLAAFGARLEAIVQELAAPHPNALGSSAASK